MINSVCYEVWIEKYFDAFISNDITVFSAVYMIDDGRQRKNTDGKEAL